MFSFNFQVNETLELFIDNFIVGDSSGSTTQQFIMLKIDCCSLFFVCFRFVIQNINTKKSTYN